MDPGTKFFLVIVLILAFAKHVLQDVMFGQMGIKKLDMKPDSSSNLNYYARVVSMLILLGVFVFLFFYNQFLS